ncbi:MAG: hypothetical protein ACI8S6_004403 [Myxococcota bacterium]|jgi:hypothetical protein
MSMNGCFSGSTISLAPRMLTFLIALLGCSPTIEEATEATIPSVWGVEALPDQDLLRVSWRST